MPEERKFYKNTIKITVLTDRPYSPDTLDEVAYDIYDGDFVGQWNIESSEGLSAGQMVEALEEVGSDASFFELDEDL